MHAHRTILGLLAVVGVLALGGSAARAAEDQEKPKPEAPPNVVTRMYDIQDLVLTKDYPYEGAVRPPGFPIVSGGAFGGMGELYGKTTATRERPLVRIGFDELRFVITRNVCLGTWVDEGGVGALELLDRWLVVTQTPENHKKIQEFLDNLRKGMAGVRTVTVEAKYVLLDDAQVEKLSAAAKTKPGSPVEAAAAALKDVGAEVVRSGRTTCLDCQIVHLTWGRAQTLIADTQPVVAEGAVGIDPTIDMALWGVMLQVMPRLAPDSESAMVDVWSVVTDPKGVTTKTTTSAFAYKGAVTESVKASIDQPEFLVQTFRTTSRIPVGKPVLLAGTDMTEMKKGKAMYLVLQVTPNK